MSHDPSRPKSWKGEDRSALPGGKKSGPSSQYTWKPGEKAAGPVVGGQKLKVGLLVLGGAACVAGLVWLVMHLIPPRPTCVTVVAGDLRAADDLSLPFNIYGYRGARDFLNWANSKCSILGERNNPWPVNTGTKENDWLKAIGDRREDSIVIYLAQPGGADEQGNPFLFDEQGGKFPFTKILEGLKNIKKKKLLIVDATQIPTDWRRGLLRNEFAEGLLKPEIEKAIADDAGLLVLCASGKGQRSWVSEEYGQSIFTHFVLKGLNGAAVADDVDPIYASDLYSYVAKNVQDWVQRNRADNQRPFNQQPILLPANSSDRATSFLIAYRDRSQAPAGKPVKRSIKETDLDAAWKRCDNLAARDPKPWVYTPRLWGRYRELLQRYGQLLRAGEDDTASKLRGAIDTLAAKIDEARKVERAAEALSAGLAMPAALGRDSAIDEVKLAEFADRPMDQLEGLPAELKKIAPPGTDDAVPRLKYVGHLLSIAKENPKRLNDVAARITRIDDGGATRPAEAHLAVMLANYKGIPGWTKPADELIQLALATRQLADEAALSVGLAAGHPYSERLPRGLVDEVLKADGERRRGEDLLFTAAKNHPEAKNLLTGAKQKYEEVQKAAKPIRRALEVRDLVFANLPTLTEWVALARPKGMPIEERVRGLVSLWKETHALADRLALLDPLDPNAPPPRTLIDVPTDNPGGKNLESLTESVFKGYENLLKTYRDAAVLLARSKSEGQQTELQEMEYALAVPGPLLGAADRNLLVKRARDNSAKLAQGDQLPLTGDAVNERDLAQYQGQIARAILGTRMLDEFSGSGLGRAGDLMDDSAPKLGMQLGGHWQKLLKEPDNANREDSAKTAIPLPWREQLALLAGTRREPPDEPALVARRMRWAETFRRLARRAELDHWYDEKSPSQPFSENLAKKYYKALPAEESNTQIASLEKRRELGQFKVDPPAEQILHTEKEVKPRFVIRGINAEFEPGLATVTPKLDQQTVLALQKPPEPHPVNIAKDAEEVVSLTALTPLDSLTEAVDASVTLTAYYRGQLITKAIAKLPVRPFPDLMVSRPPPKMGAQIAARADEELDLGAIAIVFDLSGSMNDGTKIADAKNALRLFQRSIPAGTRVMLWVYGHHKEEARWEESGERLLYEPNWDPRDARKSESLFNRVANLNGYGYTPLLATMLKALDDPDFKSASGFKTLVVLTDGCDNISGKAPTPAHTKQIAAQFQRDVVANKREVSIQMMLFQLQAEQKIADEQFPDAAFAALGRQSRKWKAANAAQLNEHLALSVRPRVEIYRRNQKLPFEILARKPHEPLEWTPSPPLTEFGEYEAHVRGLEQKIYLDDGDRLALRLRKTATGVRLVRQLMADEPDRSGVRTIDGANPDSAYVLGLLNNSLSGRGETLRGKFTLEDRANTRSESSIVRLDRPRFVWWEMHPTGQKQIPPRSRVMALHGQPAPTWELSSESWPTLNGNRLPPTVEVWASPSNAEVVDDRMFSSGEPIVNQVVDGKAAVLESVNFEDFNIPIDSAWKTELQNCLVVRVSSASGRKYQPSVSGTDVRAEVHRYYFDPAKGTHSTSAFYLPADAKTRSLRLKLVSIDDAKAKGAVRLSRELTE